MDTQLNLDDSLMKQAMLLTGMESPQELVNFALRELLTNIQQAHPDPLSTQQKSTRAYDIYRNLDLGTGGYSPVPSNLAKQGLKEILHRKVKR